MKDEPGQLCRERACSRRNRQGKSKASSLPAGCCKCQDGCSTAEDGGTQEGSLEILPEQVSLEKKKEEDCCLNTQRCENLGHF
jgi:hypothetical protein